MPRTSKNSRVKDLVDVMLILNEKQLDVDRTKQTLLHVFEKRKTHPLPYKLPEMTSEWKTPYLTLAASCNLKKNFDQAVKEIKGFYSQIFQESKGTIMVTPRPDSEK